MVNQRHELAIQALTERERSSWQEESGYMQIVRDRILKAAQNRHVSYLQAFVSEKAATSQDGLTAFDPIELAIYISRRL